MSAGWSLVSVQARPTRLDERGRTPSRPRLIRPSISAVLWGPEVHPAGWQGTTIRQGRAELDGPMTPVCHGAGAGLIPVLTDQDGRRSRRPTFSGTIQGLFLGQADNRRRGREDEVPGRA